MFTIIHSAFIRDQFPQQQPSTMHSFKPVSFCLRLFLISMAVLLTVAVPTDRTRRESSKDLCTARDSSSSKLEMRNLEKRGYCHYKVCENKYGYKNGETRNPDVINRIVCEETDDCKQVYLTVETAYYINGSQTRMNKDLVQAGCLYSKTDLRDSIPVQSMEPSRVS